MTVKNNEITIYADMERFPGYIFNNKKGKIQNIVCGFIDALCVIHFIYSGACISCFVPWKGMQETVNHG